MTRLHVVRLKIISEHEMGRSNRIRLIDIHNIIPFHGHIVPESREIHYLPCLLCSTFPFCFILILIDNSEFAHAINLYNIVRLIGWTCGIQQYTSLEEFSHDACRTADIGLFRSRCREDSCSHITITANLLHTGLVCLTLNPAEIGSLLGSDELSHYRISEGLAVRSLTAIMEKKIISPPCPKIVRLCFKLPFYFRIFISACRIFSVFCKPFQKELMDILELIVGLGPYAQRAIGCRNAPQPKPVNTRIERIGDSIVSSRIKEIAIPGIRTVGHSIIHSHQDPLRHIRDDPHPVIRHLSSLFGLEHTVTGPQKDAGCNNQKYSFNIHTVFTFLECK